MVDDDNVVLDLICTMSVYRLDSPFEFTAGFLLYYLLNPHRSPLYVVYWLHCEV